MGVKVSFKGPWARFLAFPRKLANELPKIGEKAVNREAERVAEALKQAVSSGQAGGPGLTPGVIARKGHGIKLVDSHALAGSFSVDPVSVGSPGFVGIKEGVGHPTGISMVALMTIQEFGNSTIPPRPVVGPTLNKAIPKMSTSVIKLWNKAARNIW